MRTAPSTSPAIATPEAPLRLNRFLARAGFGSRRSSEELILKGSVVINGSVCRDLSTKILPEDDVRVNGRLIHQPALRYLLLHKPPGYVSTRSDRFAQRTIFDLLPMEASTLFHVGRLDKESEGLLLLTNDGILAQQLLHPSHGVDKEYEVLLDQPFTPKAAAALKKGTWIEGAVARVESVHQFAPDKIRLVLHQGIKRQIRVMLGQLGFKVKRLIRTRIGPLKIRNLDSGNYRDLFPQEVEALRAATLVSKTALKAARKERFKKPMRKPIMVGVYRDKKKSEGHLGEPRHGATAAPRPSRGRPTLTTRTASPRTALRAQRAEARPFRRARKN